MRLSFGSPNRFFHRYLSQTLQSSTQIPSPGNAMVSPVHSCFNEKKLHKGETIQGSNTFDSTDAVQHSSSAEFPSLAESVGSSRNKLGEQKSTVDLSSTTVVSPKHAGFSSENLAYTDTSPFPHVNRLEANSPTAEGVRNGHTGSNNDAPHVEACCTHHLENKHIFEHKMQKWNEQGNWPRQVNAECPSRGVHAMPPGIRKPDSESSYKETQDVNQCVSSSPHDLYTSSHVNHMAAQLQCITLPTQFGKRTSVEMYHTESRSHPKEGKLSGNSNQSQRSHKMRPFDICENCSSQSSLPKHKEVLVTNQVTNDTREILRPGMVLLKKYIPQDDQIEIVRSCRSLGLGEGGFYQPVFNNSGAKLRLQMMCLGLDWDHNTKKYGETRQLDGARAPAIPESFVSLTEKAIEAAHDLIKANLGEGNAEDILPHMHPNICIVNFYSTSGRLGLHQDKDESIESLRKGLPVVSISLGDSAQFLYGDQRDVNKADEVILESGDVLIFGGSSRHIFHGVGSIIPDSAPDDLRLATELRPGRLNLTLREF